MMGDLNFVIFVFLYISEVSACINAEIFLIFMKLIF